MKVRVSGIQPGNSAEDLIRVKVLFEENRMHGGRPLATEGAAVEVYVEPSDSVRELHRRAIEKAREFLGRAIDMGSES